MYLLSEPDVSLHTAGERATEHPHLQLESEQGGSDSSELKLNNLETAQSDEPDAKFNNIFSAQDRESDTNSHNAKTDNNEESQLTLNNLGEATGKTLLDSDNSDRTLKYSPSIPVDLNPLVWTPYVWDKEKQRPQNFLQDVCETPCAKDTNSVTKFVNLTNGSHSNMQMVASNNGLASMIGRTIRCKNFFCFLCDCYDQTDHANRDGTLYGSVFYDENSEAEYDSKFCAYGNCCPSRQALANLSYSNDGEYTGYLSQQRVYAVVRCPRESADQTLRRECERGKGEFTIDEPVTDTTTDIVYRNKACAECHGVNSSTPWRLQIACAHFQYFYMAKSEQELLQRIKDAGPDITGLCNVYHVPLSDIVPPLSLIFFRSSDGTGDRVIRICNVTGLWADFDQDVQSGCATYTALVFRVRVNSYHYTNMFCAMCNGFKPEWYPCNSNNVIGWNDPSPKPLPLTFLLGLKNRREDYAESTEGCAVGQWLDFDVGFLNVMR